MVMGDTPVEGRPIGGESTFRPALLLMAGRALASAATLLIPVTLARAFDQTEYGTYKQLFLVFTTLYSVALIGLSDSLYYFIPRDPVRSGRYVANAMAGLALAGSTCLAALYAARYAVAEWMKNPALADHLAAIGTFVLFTLAATVLEIVLIARKRYSWAASAYVISDVARAAFFVLPVLFWSGLHALILGAVAFSALRLVVAFHLLRRELGAELRLDLGLLPAQLAYAMPFALYVLVEILQATYHQYAVSWRFDAATFALYAVGCFQVPFVDFLATPASSVMMVRMSEERREGRPAQALAIWLDITRKLALVFFPMVALLAVASREVMTVLFTERYAASAPIFALWVMSIAFSVVQTDAVMRVHAQVPFLFAVNLVRLALIVALIQPLMTAFGLLGPVLVTLLAMAVAKALHIVRMKRLMQLPVRDLLPWRALGATLVVSALSAVPVLVVRAAVTGPPLPLLIAESAAYGLTYLTLLFAAGLIDPGERAALTRFWHPTRAQPLASGGAE
jgi:O-antigen/teichoic acid export membrane protein